MGQLLVTLTASLTVLAACSQHDGSSDQVNSADLVSSPLNRPLPPTTQTQMPTSAPCIAPDPQVLTPEPGVVFEFRRPTGGPSALLYRMGQTRHGITTFEEGIYDTTRDTLSDALNSDFSTTLRSTLGVLPVYVTVADADLRRTFRYGDGRAPAVFESFPFDQEVVLSGEQSLFDYGRTYFNDDNISLRLVSCGQRKIGENTYTISTFERTMTKMVAQGGRLREIPQTYTLTVAHELGWIVEEKMKDSEGIQLYAIHRPAP